MQYQRKHKEETEQNKENNNVKEIRTTYTTLEKTSAEKRPSRITSKPINIATITTGKKEIKKNEMIKKITYTKTEKQFVKKESPSLMGNNTSNTRVYFSSRYNNRKQDETSPIFKENISGIEDSEYNIHTLNARKSPDKISYGRNSIENEKQIKIKNNSQASNTPILEVPPFLDRDTFQTNTNESIKINNSTFNTNIKSYRPPMIPQNKMSPIQHYDDGNSSYDNKRYTEQRNRYANYLTTNMNTNTNIENMGLNISNINNNNIPQESRNTVGRLRGRFLTDANSPSYNNDRVNSQTSNHVSYKELKKIVKKFNKVYDPYRNEKGLLVKQSQITLPGASDEIFNNRYRVLSKMNKLSNILLAKQKKYDEDILSSRGNSKERNISLEKDKSLSRNSNSMNKNIKNTKKLSLVSLAMMSAKGLNTEDRTILRKNRIEKGGVVDLAQEKIKKNKFKIKKATKITGGGKTIIKSNPKYREKAAKIIQAWWKELKDIYNYKLSQIIKIQSIWKGRWVRKNIYDLLYLNYLYLSFCEKIEKVLTNKMTKYALDKLIMNQKYYQAIDENKLKGLVLKADKNRIIILKNYWDKWIKKLMKEKDRKNKGKNLIQIRADKENKLGKLRTAFTIWKYNIKMENIKNKYGKNNDEIVEENNINGKKIIKITKISEKERYISPEIKDNVIEKDKFKGLLHILEGANRYHKKQAFYETKPRIINYLKELTKEEKLKNILNNKTKKIYNIFKKTIYKWLTKTIKITSQNEIENENEERKAEHDNLKVKMFLRRIENVKKKQKKYLIRKYFYRYLKIVLLMAKQEERQKVLDMYKSDTTNFYKDEYSYSDKDSQFSLTSYARIRNRKKKITLNNISNKLEGIKILEKFIWRQTYENILDCFINRLDNETIRKYMKKIIKIKERINENILKNYLDKWKNNCMMKKNDDLKSKMFIKIIKIIIENNRKKILSKRLYQWQKIVHILERKDNLFLKSKNTYTFIDNIKNFTNKKYAPFFIDILKHIKKEKSLNELLKKNIINQDIKKNQDLLKNNMNKWKNKVTDYEIGKLKGKLLLKIYDKYKATKTKDAINKIFTKWENNTIFFDKIKNKINKENIDTFTKMNNNDKKIILLRAIIRNINRKNNETKLRKYMNIWEKNIQDRNKTLGAAGMYIIKIYKDNNGKFLLNKLKNNRKIQILKNLIKNYAKLSIKRAIREYYFRRWIYITKNLQQIENANIIQHYCLRKLKNKINDNKWKKLSSLLKNKNRINKIIKILKKLKKYLCIIKLIKALTRNNKGNIFDKSHMTFFFVKLNDFLNDLSNQDYTLLFLKRVINKQNNKINRILLKNAFNIWKNKVSDYEIGKLKGKLLLKIYDKYTNGKIKDNLKKILSKWKNNTIFLDKIKNKVNQENIHKFTIKSYKDKTIIIIRALVRNINRKNNEIILRKYFNIWKKNIQDRNQIFGDAIKNIIKTIKKGEGRYIFNKLKDNKVENTLKTIINKYSRPKEEILDSYFLRWRYITKKIEQIENANIIQKFCEINLRIKINANRWKKLHILLKNRIRNNNIKSILNQMKKFLSIIKLIKALKGNKKRNIFDKSHMAFFFVKLKDFLNDLNNQDYSFLLLKKIINKQNNKKNKILLKNALNKWKNKVADYEIGKLKGKLILKIYDKYNGTKTKEIIKKAISKWENYTIFVDKIKNKVNKENTDKFTKINKKDKTIIIIRSLIRNINRKNNNIKLRKYFNDWKRNIQDRNKILGAAGLYIIKILKLNNAKFFFNKLKDNKLNDREEILKKIIKRKERLNNDVLDSYLYKWRYKTKKLEQIENANIIQKFCEIKLRKRDVVKKWKRLYLLLRNIVRKIDVFDILKKVKKYLSIIKLIKVLKGNNKNNLFDKNHMASFFDKLMHLKRFYSNVTNLKIIISRQDEINNKNLMRNILIKWRNIVADLEIEKLKGKLLLKIYDKNKTSKIKSILKSILRKWENKAIILHNIKNKINKENADKYTAKNKQEKIIILLRAIIRNMNRKNSDIKLRKYFSDWKRNIQDRNKTLGAAGLYIIKILKLNNTKFFFNKLKDNRKEKILKNLFIKYAKLRKNNDILDSYLSKWRYKTKKLEQIENANIIQKFCEIKLRKRDVVKKWKRLYLLLRNIVRKIDVFDILKKVKKYLSIIKLIKVLKGNNKNSIFDKKHMEYFFDKLNNLLNELENKDYSYQNLRKIIIKQNNNKKNSILKKVLNKWKNEVADYEIGKLKGKLLVKMYDKYNTSKIREILRKTISRWENHTIFVDKIKNKVNKENTDKFTKINKKDKITIIVKSILRNINRINNEKTLRKYINRWKKNINDRNKNINDASTKIIKNIKKNQGTYFIGNLKVIKRDYIISKIIKRNERPNNDILDSYLSKWRYKIKKIEQIENANIIQKFCEIKLRKRDVVKKWKRLYLLLRNKNRNNNIKDILKLIKYFIGIKKLGKILKGNNNKNIFDILNRQKDIKKISIILIELLEKFALKDNENLLKTYLSKWRNNTIKKNNQEEVLDKMMKILEIKIIKKSVKNLSDASQIIKVLNDITKARALYFLRKIKKEGKKNNLYINLSKDLVNVNKELLNEKKKPLIDKILKIYIYKVLSNLFNNIEKFQKNIIKSNIKDLFSRLHIINVTKRKKRYRKINKIERKPYLHRGMKFHFNIKPEIKRDEKNNKTIVYKRLTPFLVKYLSKKCKNQKKDVFDAIKYNNVGLGDKFCKLLKSFSKKTQIPDKEDLVDSLKYYVYIKLTKVSSSNKLYYLIRKAIIRRILNISKTAGNLNRLIRLINMTITHRKIAKDRWLLRLIKKWRFITFVKKMAMKKMELMYKDLHVNYLEMADTVLKDGSPLGPNGANFLHDINKDKYIYDFYDPYLVKGAKPYRAIKKQYVFEPLDVEIERRIKTIQEIETVDKIKEINRSYYDKDDNNNKEISNKKYTVLKTKKVDVNPKKSKKSGNIKIKKSGKGEGKIPVKKEVKNYGNNIIKGSIKNRTIEYDQGGSRESFKSEIKDYSKEDLSESINSEIRESIRNEIRESMKNDFGNNYGLNLGKEYLSYKNEKIMKDNNNNNANYYNSKEYYKGPDFKKYEKKTK